MNDQGLLSISQALMQELRLITQPLKNFRGEMSGKTSTSCVCWTKDDIGCTEEERLNAIAGVH